MSMEGCPGNLWPIKDTLQSQCPLGCQRRLACCVRGAGLRRWLAYRGSDRQHPRQGTPLCRRRKRGAHVEAIGSSRGGRNTKVHAITGRYGRPLAFLLTPGQVADCRAAEHLLNSLPRRCIVHADRAYDTNRIHDLIEEQGAVPNIPPKRNRRLKSCFSQIPLQRPQCYRTQVLSAQRLPASRHTL